MLRHLALSVSLATLIATPAAAVDIGVDALSVIVYDQGVLQSGTFFEVELQAPIGNFDTGPNTNSYDVTDPASNGFLTFDGSFGGNDFWFADIGDAAAVDSDLTITMTGLQSANLAITQDIGLPGGFPALDSFSVSGTDLTVNWDCTLCVAGAGAGTSFLNIYAFDVLTDGAAFEVAAFDDLLSGVTGTAMIDLTAAAPGQYRLELEFFSQTSFSDSTTDLGNTWNVTHGRSVLNGGFLLTVVPEPGSGLLVAAGLLGLAAMTRTKRS